MHEINTTGYGLTLGVHSYIASTQHVIAKPARAGSYAINRIMTVVVIDGEPTLLESSV